MLSPTDRSVSTAYNVTDVSLNSEIGGVETFLKL